MKVDLHCHSTASDGTDSPESVVEKAVAAGVDLLALTDHDTVAGIRRARAAAQGRLLLVPGVEFTAHWKRDEIHIVGLGIDHESDQITEAVSQQQDRRRERALNIANKLIKIVGLKETPEQLCRQLRESMVPVDFEHELARPHFADYLVQKGCCKTLQQAFDKYLGAGKRAYVHTEWPACSEVVSWIQNSGGVAVLAHPAKYGYTATKRRRLIAAFAEAGGQAMETNSHDHRQLAEQLAREAEAHGLAASWGSDAHGQRTPWLRLGGIGHFVNAAPKVWEVFPDLTKVGVLELV